MADNAPLPLATGSTRNAATDQVTYSGDIADVQLMRIVEVTGAEGSKTVISAGLALDGTDVTTPSPAMPAGGVGIRGWLSAIWTKINASLAVTGTFWQATQPVSLTSTTITGSVAVTGGLTDTQLRATAVPVSGTFFQATQPVSGAFFQATQPVSLATNTPTLAAGTAIAGKFGIDQTTPQNTNQVSVNPTTLAVTVTAAANTAATATLPAVAGQFHYITDIEIMRTATAALAGTATLVATTTNLPGSLAWSIGNAMAAGASSKDVTIQFNNPLKSSVVNTATTIVMPVPGAAVLWRANVYYYTAA